MSTKPNKVKETTDVTGGNYIRVIQGDPAQNKVIPVTNLFSDPDVVDIIKENTSLELSTSLNESVTGKGSDATVVKILHDRIKDLEKLIIPSTFLIDGTSDNNPTLNFNKLDNTELKVVWSDGEVYTTSDIGNVSIGKNDSINSDVTASVYCAGEYELINNCVGEYVKEVVLNPSVTNIGDYAFMYCQSLTSIVIPDSVTSIGNSTFTNCTSLTSIVIPDSVNSIGEYAFDGCSSLTSINVDSNNKYYSSDDGVLFDKNKTTLILYPIGKLDDSYIIPDSVTNIGDEAFYSCTSLTSIVIPDSVTNIGNGTFYECTSLTSIVIPDSVTSLGDDTFGECASLTSVTIGNSVTNIGNNAFINCTSLNTYNFYPLVAPTVQSNTFPSNIGVTLHIPSTSTGYDVSPWTDTDKFATVINDL